MRLTDDELRDVLERAEEIQRSSRHEARQRVKVTDGWGDTKTFPLADVWLEAARKPELKSSRMRVYLTLLSAGAGVGGIVGSILTALLMR